MDEDSTFGENDTNSTGKRNLLPAPFDAILLFFVVIILIFIIIAISLPYGILISVILIAIFAIILPLLWYISKKKFDCKTFLRLKRTTSPSFILFLILLIGIIYIIELFAYYVYIPLVGSTPYEVNYDQFLQNDYEFVIFVIVSITLLPVAEELLFRGFIQKTFEIRYVPIIAIFITSFLFALYHLNPWQFPFILLLGIVFGFAAFKTDSILPPIFMHACTNLIGLLLENRLYYWFSQFQFPSSLVLVLPILVWIAVIGYLLKKWDTHLHFFQQ
jgi:membrane protease YdiL (CAAX protease family)